MDTRASSRTIRFSDGSAFVRLNAMALVSMSATSAALEDEARQRLIATIVQWCASALAWTENLADLERRQAE
jgi:hypothetical protein